MDDRYNHHNRRNYSLKVHIVLATKYRRQLLKGNMADDAKQKIFDICKSHHWEIIAMETDKDQTHYLWSKYNGFLSKQYGKKRIFWSDGYFACSIGEISSTTIQKYMESQG